MGYFHTSSEGEGKDNALLDKEVARCSIVMGHIPRQIAGTFIPKAGKRDATLPKSFKTIKFYIIHTED